MKPETAEHAAYTPEEDTLYEASNLARAANYIIDRILSFILVVLAFSRPDGLVDIDPKSARAIYSLIFLSIFILYYLLFEYFFGKTLAKFITGTKVVDQDGSKPSFYTLFIRTMSRMIPFYSLSLLFSKRPWHDSLSETVVVHSRSTFIMKVIPITLLVGIVIFALSFRSKGKSGTIKIQEITGFWAFEAKPVSDHPFAFQLNPDSTASVYMRKGHTTGTWSPVRSADKNAGPDAVSEVHVEYRYEGVQYKLVLGVRKAKMRNYLSDGKVLYWRPNNLAQSEFRARNNHPTRAKSFRVQLPPVSISAGKSQGPAGSARQSSDSSSEKSRSK